MKKESLSNLKVYQTTGLSKVGVHSGLHVKEENGKWFFLPITTTPQKHYKFKKHIDTGADNPSSVFLGTKIVSTNIKNRKRLTKKRIYPEDEDNVLSIIKKALKKPMNLVTTTCQPTMGVSIRLTH